MNLQLKYLLCCLILTSTFVNGNPSSVGLCISGYLFDEVIIAGKTNVNSFLLNYRQETYSDITQQEHQKETLSVHIQAQNIKAESEAMLSDFLGLIHADQHPEIIISMDKQLAGSFNDGSKMMNNPICLSINGITKRYSCLLELKNCNQNEFCLSGKLDVLLTDFGIVPPRKFFGIVKVRNEVFVSFKVQFITNKKETKIEI